MTHRISISKKNNSYGYMPEEFFLNKIADPSTPIKDIESNNLMTISKGSFSELHIEIAQQHGPT